MCFSDGFEKKKKRSLGQHDRNKIWPKKLIWLPFEGADYCSLNFESTDCVIVAFQQRLEGERGR